MACSLKDGSNAPQLRLGRLEEHFVGMELLLIALNFEVATKQSIKLSFEFATK